MVALKCQLFWASFWSICLSYENNKNGIEIFLTEVIKSLSIVKIHCQGKKIYELYILWVYLHCSFTGLFSFPAYIINPKFCTLEHFDVDNFNSDLSFNATKVKKSNHSIHRDGAKHKS